MIRLFVAVDCPKISLPELYSLAADTPSHITLRFLGDVHASLVGDLGRALERTLQGAHGGMLEIKGLGAFPRPSRPRVLWAGLVDATGFLNDLHRRVSEAVEGLGMPPEDHPFHPHVTLARIKGWAKEDIARRAIEAHRSESFAKFTVPAVLLVQSTLTREGAIHRPLLSVPLAPVPS